ncbi:MAG: hypothetical protein ACNY01_10890, partial [Desulfobacteria bacterium]
VAPRVTYPDMHLEYEPKFCVIRGHFFVSRSLNKKNKNVALSQTILQNCSFNETHKPLLLNNILK